MSETLPATPEPLFSDARWLRRLAGGLAADPSAADDLVQETWLAWLRGGAQRGVASPRAWMRRVLFREVGHQARRNVLRREREQGAARREALPSTIELAERAELQRTLAAAVLALEEPYRSTILWRYYSDLSCEQIAERLGAPASTVRNRLRRGLELLRLALGQRGVSQAGCLGFKVGKWGDECIPGMEKAIVMGTSVKITLVAAAVIVAAFMLWNEFQGLDPSAPEAAMPEVAEAPRSALVNEAGPRTAIQPPAARAQEPTALVDSPERPEEIVSATSALDAMQAQLRSQIEASLLGHVDPAFYLALAQQLTKLEPGELATEPAPGGDLRYPLKGTPDGMQAEYCLSTAEKAAGGGRMDGLKVTLDNPFDDEPYVVEGLPRRPAEVMLGLWRNPAGEIQHFTILTNLYPRRLPDFFSSDSMIFSYDVQKPLAVQGDVAGTQDGKPGVIKDTPIVIVGGKWPDLDALKQFNAGMNALHAKTQR